ncbi:MAG: hypothetical protein ACXV8I_09670 [Methylobacter sp.]
MLPILIVLMSVFLLSACSTMPSGPSVLILPGTGKNFDQFHHDDLACRQLAHTQLSTLQKEPDSKEEGQQNYDIVYIQCMYGKGHRVPVPGDLMYDTLQEWHSPPPTNLPAPPQTTRPGSAVNPVQ